MRSEGSGDGDVAAASGSHLSRYIGSHVITARQEGWHNRDRARHAGDHVAYHRTEHVDEGELHAVTDRLRKEGARDNSWSISRFKGLGEMNAEQLWDTTLNPATRTLRLVTLEDAERADFVFDELMGNEVEGRKKWIMANAKKAELDL